MKEYFFDDENEDKVETCQMLFDRIKREIEGNNQAELSESDVQIGVNSIDTPTLSPTDNINPGK